MSELGRYRVRNWLGSKGYFDSLDDAKRMAACAADEQHAKTYVEDTQPEEGQASRWEITKNGDIRVIEYGAA